MICRRERERERKRKKRVVQQKKEKAFHDVFDVCLRVRVRCESVRGCGELVWVRLRETHSLPLSLSLRLRLRLYLSLSLFFLLFSSEYGYVQ